MAGCRRHIKLNKESVKSNRGMTLVELVVAFVLLGIFMIAASRVISYTMGIYYSAKGTSYGLEVSNMISNKIIGQLENAGTCSSFYTIGAFGDEEEVSWPTITKGSVNESGKRIDSIKFVDATGSIITITAGPAFKEDSRNYLIIHYDETAGYGEPLENPDDDPGYAAVDWTFDSKAYMGYEIIGLEFNKADSSYPDNVLQMVLTLHSSKYGDYAYSSYIKCYGVEKVQ